MKKINNYKGGDIMNKKYLVIPQSHDLNRGDQALVWETAHLAKDANFHGEYYLMGEDNDNIKQTKQEGFTPFSPILKHPSRLFKNKNNIHYGISLKLKWGLVAIFDFIFSLLLLFKPSRNILEKTMSKDKRHAMSLFKDADAVFVKGGGFVHGYGGIVSSYYIYFVLYHVILSQRLGKPVYFFSNSFGPFNGPFVKLLVKKVMKKCEFISARESISSRMVAKDLGLNIPVNPDLGFFLKPTKKDEMKEYLLNYGVPLAHKECVAITVRPYRFPEYDNPKKAYENYKNTMVNFIKYLDKQGYHTVLVEHTLSTNSHESDMSSIRDIIPNIKKCDYTVISDDNLNSREVKSLYSHCSYMVGTRFHSVIFALAEKVPSIAVTYGGNKGDGIMKDIGIPEYAIPISEIQLDKLINKFVMLVENRSRTIEMIDDYLLKIEDDRKGIIQKIKK